MEVDLSSAEALDKAIASREELRDNAVGLEVMILHIFGYDEEIFFELPGRFLKGLADRDTVIFMDLMKGVFPTGDNLFLRNGQCDGRFVKVSFAVMLMGHLYCYPAADNPWIKLFEFSGTFSDLSLDIFLILRFYVSQNYFKGYLHTDILSTNAL